MAKQYIFIDLFEDRKLLDRLMGFGHLGCSIHVEYEFPMLHTLSYRLIHKQNDSKEMSKNLFCLVYANLNGKILGK